MQAELQISAAWVHGFVLTMARVGGVFVFVPIPGIRSGPNFARLLVSIAVSLALFSKWPRGTSLPPDPGGLLLWGLSELALGVTVGLFVSFLTEIVSFGAQAISLPAGYSYATSIDPSTQADSNVLISMAQILAGMLFFAFDIHHQLIAAMARSFERYPPGQFALTPSIAEQVVNAGATMLSLGLALVIPILSFLLMIDVALALLGRLSAQIQVLTVSFPAKMLASLALLAILATAIPRVFEKGASQILAYVWELVAG